MLIEHDSADQLEKDYGQGFSIDQQDDELTEMYCEGFSVREMAEHFGRTKGAIQSRIKKLRLYETYD